MSHKAAKRLRKAGLGHLQHRVRQLDHAGRVKMAALMMAYGARAPRRVDEPPTEMPADKGLLNGACNRSACLARPATWWNKSTLAHYCEDCAKQINEYCPDSKDLYGEQLCTPVT